ncbi:MAG: hypothetical protein JWR07_4455 [Nevskia sp.]|nr:hypothetical protein [Nevskia sp.]
MLIAKSRWLPTSICTGLLAGCSGAPSQNILGSYFPSWLICALVGLFGSILVREVLNAAGVGKSVPVPILVYLALAVALSFALWLTWIG